MEEYWYHYKDDIWNGSFWVPMEEYWKDDDDDGAAGSALGSTTNVS